MSRWLSIRSGAVLAAGAFMLAAAISLTPALAAGGGGGSSNTRSVGPKLTCPSGWVLNQQTRKCQRQSGSLSDELPAVGWNDVDPKFVEAAVLAHSGQYEAAIDALYALQRPKDPYVLNYLGYSHRKLGRTDTALAFYHKALSIRPDYVRAREYLGEGYVAMGRIDEAKEQLALIAEQCGTQCDEYITLSKKIADHLGESAS